MERIINSLLSFVAIVVLLPFMIPVDYKIVFLTDWVILFPKSNFPHKLAKALPEKLNIYPD